MIRAAFPILLFLASTLPAQTPYGSGAPGTGGITPTLSCNQAWMGNASFAYQVQGGLGGAPALLALSQQRASFFVGTTEILVDLAPPNLLLLLLIALGGPPGAPGAGTYSLPVPLTFPPQPALAGFTLYAQVVVIDFPTPGSPAATRGLRVELTYPPLVFVGTSVGGSTDPYYLVDPLGPSLAHQGGLAQTDNVTDAVFTHGGTNLFTASSIRNTVNVADVTVIPPTWRTIYTSAGNGCYGVGFDRDAQRVYTLTNPGTGARELVALDGNPLSPNFGQRITNSNGLSGGSTFIERWHLSASARYAAVLKYLPDVMLLVDTQVGSPTYLQTLVTSVVPRTNTSGFALASNIEITSDDRFVLITISDTGSPGEVARYDLQARQWIDHNPGMPGAQPIGPNSAPPVPFGLIPYGLAVSRDGRFANVCGTVGWIGRLDFDPSNPLSYAWTPFNPGISLVQSWDLDLNGDDARVATGVFGSTPGPYLAVIDAASGTSLGTVPTPGAGNVYTIRYR
jgi:hypothetical protein